MNFYGLSSLEKIKFLFFLFSYRSFRAQQPTRTVSPVLLIQTFLAFYSLRSTRFLQVIRKSFLLSFLCAIRNKLFIEGQHRHISDKRQKSTITAESNWKNENNSGWRSSKQFSNKCRKSSGIASVSLYSSVIGLVKTRTILSTNQIQIGK